MAAVPGPGPFVPAEPGRTGSPDGGPEPADGAPPGGVYVPLPSTARSTGGATVERAGDAPGGGTASGAGGSAGAPRDPAPRSEAAEGGAPWERAPRPAAPGLERLAAELAGTVRTVVDYPAPAQRFHDVTPIFQAPELFRGTVEALAEEARRRGAEVVAGIDPRGLLLGPCVALRLGLPFVPVAAPGTLPGDTRVADRRLERAVPLRLAVQRGRLRSGERVLLVDDLLVTGATAATAAGLLEEVGGIVAGVAFVAEVERGGGRRRLGRYNVFSILAL